MVRGITRSFIIAIFILGLTVCSSIAQSDKDTAILSKGRVALNDGLYDLAEKQFALYLKKAGGDLDDKQLEEAFLFLVRSKYEQKKYQDILDTLTSRNKLARRILKRGSFVFWRALAKYEMKKTDEAIEELAGFKKETSGLEYIQRVQRLQGWCYLRKDNTEKALEIFSNFDSLYGDSAEAPANLLDWGTTLLDVNSSDKALVVFSKLVESPVESTEVFQGRYWLGKILIQEKKWGDAVKVLSVLANSEKAWEDIRAEAWYLMAVSYIAQKKNVEAADALKKGLEVARSKELKVKGGFDLGLLLLDIGKHKEGIALLREYISASPEDSRAESAQLRLAGLVLDQADYQGAVNEYQKYLETYTNTVGQAQAHFGKGWGFINIGRYAESAVSFSKAYNLFTDPALKEESLFKVGDAYFANRQYKLALDTYEKWFVEFPESKLVPQAVYQIGESIARDGRHEEAKKKFKMLVSKYPASPFAAEALLRAAEIEIEQGNMLKAVDNLSDVINVYSNTAHVAEAVHGRGLAFHKLYRFSDALKDFERIKNEFSDREVAEQAFFMRGMCYYGLWRDEEALAVCEEFIGKYPKSHWVPDITFWVAKYKYNHGKYADAAKNFITFVEKFPKNQLADDSLLWAGRSYSEVKEYKRAIELFGKFVKDYPGSSKTPEVRFSQADAFYKLGEYSAAILVYEEMVNKYPESNLIAESWKRKGYCQFMLGNEKEMNRYEEGVESFLVTISSSEATLPIIFESECMIGRCYEKLDRTAEALEQYYLKVVVRYFEEQEKGIRHNKTSKFWFTRSVMYAEDILRAKEDWRALVNLLKRVVDSGVPYASDAQEKIKKIKSEHWWLFY